MENGAVRENEVAVQNFKNLRYEVNMLLYIQLKKSQRERALVQIDQHSLSLAHLVNANDDKCMAFRFADEDCMILSAILQGRTNLMQLQCRSFRMNHMLLLTAYVL